jgi:trans-aconitate methyltransferase
MTQYRKTLYQQYFSNQIAANYSSQQWDNRVFSVDILPHLPQNYNAKIIEIGCGHGNLLHYLKEVMLFPQLNSACFELSELIFARVSNRNH